MPNLNFLDDLAQLGARTTHAHSAMIFKRELANDVVTVAGRYETLYDPSTKFPAPKLITPEVNFVAIPDVRKDERLAGHPILDYLPRVDSLMVANISPNINYQGRYRFTLVIVNASAEAFAPGETFSSFSHVVDVCRQFVSALGHEEAFMAESDAVPIPAYQMPTDMFGHVLNVRSLFEDRAADYLIKTLPRKSQLHENNGGGFISLRTWRKAIKDKQMEAFAMTSNNPTASFLDAVAEEIVVSVGKTFGRKSISLVVPIPSLDVTRDKRTANLLAQRVAEKLGVRKLVALEIAKPTAPQVSVGKGDEYKLPFKLNQKADGAVLLVDDFDESGRTIDAAQACVRESGSTCFAMSWIAPSSN